MVETTRTAVATTRADTLFHLLVGIVFIVVVFHTHRIESSVVLVLLGFALGWIAGIRRSSVLCFEVF
jgi:hypothetical protein